MIPLLLLFLEPLNAATNGQLLPIASATADTYHEYDPPQKAIDGDTSTYYHTGTAPEPPQWLKLELEEPALVSRVVIVNR